MGFSDFISQSTLGLGMEDELVKNPSKRPCGRVVTREDENTKCEERKS